MRTWPVALCLATLLALGAAIFSHHRAPATVAAVAAPVIAVARVPETPDPDDAPVATQAAAKAPEPMPLAIALLPAPGPPDASRPSAGPDGDLLVGADGAAELGQLAYHAAVRDAALAQSAEGFFREAGELLERSPAPSAAALPALNLRQWVTAATAPTLALPLHAGRASLGWITHAIRDEQQLPAPNAVRLEEILNLFSLRPAGCAAICHGVSLTTESLPCPWKPSATLLLISIRGAADAAHDVTATFHADPATVARYRLLGFAPPAGLSPGPLPTQLAAKSLTSLVLEIDPSSTAAAFGTLDWTLGGQPVAAISITHHRAAEPSDDARFAALVCAFAQWLAHDQPALVDADLLAALAREVASASLPPERADFLTLIEEALGL